MGKKSTTIGQDDWKEDLKIKHAMVREFKAKFYLKKMSNDIKKLITEYYRDYGKMNDEEILEI